MNKIKKSSSIERERERKGRKEKRSENNGIERSLIAHKM